MHKRELIIAISITLLATGFFFSKTFFKGLVPFPGDLLVAEYKPWRTYSYLGFTPGAVPNKAQFPDTLRQLYPWKNLTTTLIAQKQLPLWNPYNFSGSPLLANFQSAPFYPLNFLYFFLPILTSWTILVIVQPILAILFTYLYARNVGLKTLPSWFAAFSYGFSLFMTVWLEYNTIGQVILWLPLVLLSIERRLKLILLFALTAAAFAGHPQIFFYLLIFTTIYIFYRIRPLADAVKLTFFSSVSLLIAAVQLIPGLELILNAARSPHDPEFLVNKVLIAPWQLLMLPFPDIFGNPATRTWWPNDTYIGKVTSIGFIPLFFLPAVGRRISHPLVKFYLVTTVFILLNVTANPLSKSLASLPIPFFSTASPTLMIFLFSFTFALTCAFGIDQWITEKHSLNKLLKRCLQVVLLFAILWVILLMAPKINQILIARKAILYATILAGFTLIVFTVAIIKPKSRNLALILLLLVHVLDLWMYFRKFIPFSPPEFVFPQAAVVNFLKNHQGIDRHWGYGTAAIEANLATQLYIYSPDGYDPLYPRWYGEFISGAADGSIHSSFDVTNRSDAIITPGFGRNDLPDNFNRLRILDSLGVKYILDRAENGSTLETFPPDRFHLIYEQDGWKIFENTKAAPRAFLTSTYKLYENNIQFAKLFFSQNFDPTKEILLNKKPSEDFVNGEAGTVEIISYQPNEIQLKVNTDSNKLLFLSDTYYPGWKAFVNSKETEILRANYAFRAIAIPQGSHLVRFVFAPTSVKIGLYLTMAGIILTGIWLIKKDR